MLKFPYVVEYRLGLGQVEFSVAEKLLAEYQDFYLYNQSQLNEIFRKYEQADGEEDEKLLALRRQKAEAAAKAATDHWAKLFGSMDFAESTLVGLQINWDDLQQIMIEEFRTKTHPTDSAMNYIAPQLRRLCSVLLFAERIQTQIKKKDIDLVVQPKFEEMLGKMAAGEVVEVPEFTKIKHQIQKLKNPEAITKFVEELI